ncbi:MAG: hypothetical protein K0Q93_2040 [Nocardioidaceae bacterium]|jgi:hypothetical protein|nr:hypothetical protein [Nocardioidaceae bacterium]
MSSSRAGDGGGAGPGDGSEDGSGFFRAGPKLTPEDRVRDFARAQVRAGLLDAHAVLQEVTEAVADERITDDPAAMAADLVRAERERLAVDQQSWEVPTDHDRLVAAFDELAGSDVVVLQAIEDHWTAQAELRRRAAEGRPPLGVAWFTAPDVWHAVDHGMLELNVWHGDSANVAPGEPLLDLVIEVLARHGLAAHFDEGRIEISASWHRRQALAPVAGQAPEQYAPR